MKETITLLNAETFDIVILISLAATPEFDVVKWLQHNSTTVKVILITAAGAAPSPHANVIASFTLPLDCIKNQPGEKWLFPHHVSQAVPRAIASAQSQPRRSSPRIFK